jgi:hypothetical protein
MSLGSSFHTTYPILPYLPLTSTTLKFSTSFHSSSLYNKCASAFVSEKSNHLGNKSELQNELTLLFLWFLAPDMIAHSHWLYMRRWFHDLKILALLEGQVEHPWRKFQIDWNFIRWGPISKVIIVGWTWVLELAPHSFVKHSKSV